MAIVQNSNLVRNYSQARLSRDARFDGVFFTAVKTTGIYCRSICPANPPKEDNVEYHDSAISASNSGFRPCLRCRPETAPFSTSWIGNETTLKRAVRLIHQGHLSEHSVEELSSRLGVSSRYLRALFKKYLGVSPGRYAVHQKCLLAKKLLHETRLPITEIAYASGFNSVRRFNQVIKSSLGLTPTAIRKQRLETHVSNANIVLRLSYRPPYDWPFVFDFLADRLIEGIEWIQDGDYGRTFQTNKGNVGYFHISPEPEKHRVRVELSIEDTSEIYPIVQRIRECFDLDAPISDIEKQLMTVLPNSAAFLSGLRIPGIWDSFEAGVRAILGQQVTVTQAHKLVALLVDKLGHSLELDSQKKPLKLFPKPQDILQSDLSFFKMPQARKDTLKRLAKHFIETDDPDEVLAWQDIKGIGPWTVNYVRLRASKDPDVWLTGDAGVKNALALFDDFIDTDSAAPWRSYLVFHLWNQLISQSK